MAVEQTKAWYHRIGPGLITACVVIGPGSILTSSTVGAANGYSMSWVVIVAVLCMLSYMALGTRLGAVADMSNGELLAKYAGRWLAVLLGASVFFISSAYQFGNNLGVLSAISEAQNYLPVSWRLRSEWILIGLNLLAILCLFALKDFYRFLERLMAVFVGLMLVSFAINLAFARPPIVELAAGMLPPIGAISAAVSDSLVDDAATDRGIDLSLLALVGTTFVVTGAYFQSYLVRQ
ncbi:MAG: divalent metal cation transporter, partial [Planctomycetales bacterium]|nr:divalent metal cation transporter [Planctomycetales bacterium]